MSPRPRSRTLGRAPTRRKALVGLGVAATALLAFPAVAGAQEADPVADARPAGQPALGRHRRRPRHLHAGRLRPGRDRLLPGQARRPRGEHELRHLRPRLRRLLPRRLRPDVRRLLACRSSASTRAPRRAAHRQSATGSSSGRAASPSPTWSGPAAPVPRPSASSSTWWPSWTPWPRSRPGPWPSGGSGRASSAGASSAAPSTTRSSAPGPGAAAGCRQLGNSMDLGFGYVDFAGSGVVHAVGGVAGLAGAIVLGPRIGKFNKDGSANTIPGHHIPMAMLGTLHPAVRLVRLQRRLDLRGDRRAVRHRGRPTRPSPVPSAPSSSMFYMHDARPASPTPG